ncbi:VOC family protein [Candidatus Sumerlaeota bacterium]|nr:VOC family protein [Candidatus Sumerlaeota bacterium]
MQKIVPFLWFDNNAEKAVRFYVSVFKKSKVNKIVRCGDAGPGPKGSILYITFKLEGQDFYAINGGSYYKINPGISLFVNCKDQKEVDRIWKKMAKGGQELQCGWITDKFGVTWQIIPIELMKMQEGKDPRKVARVMQAMCKMVKLDVKKLKKAYDGK